MVFLMRNFISADTNRNHFFDWRKLIAPRSVKKIAGKLGNRKLLRASFRSFFRDL